MIRDRRLVALAIAARLATPEEVAWFARPPEYDPLADLTPEERQAYVVASCASGAPAALPPVSVIIDGRRIPAPPARPARRGRRARTPRTDGATSPETPLCAPVSDATATDVPT